jgi:SAM-dependent methyltransferase
LTQIVDACDTAAAYPDDYYGSETAKFSGAAGRARRFWHARRAKRLRARFATVANPIIYDIGCGDGEFLAACRDRGFRVRGCEPVARPRHQAAQRLECVIDEEAFAGDGDARYDVITAWQVIEHVADPAALLKAAREHLTPDGILAVSTVNLNSIQASLFGSHWLHLDPPRHVWVAPRRAVEFLLERCGFEVVSRAWNHLEFGPIGYVDSAINLVDNRRDRLLDCLKNGFHGAGHKCLWLVAAMLTPLGIALSAAETAMGRSATFELYARRRVDEAPPPHPERNAP